MIRSRWLVVLTSGRTIRPPFAIAREGSRWRARSHRRRGRALGSAQRQRHGAASTTGCQNKCANGAVSGLKMSATRCTAGRDMFERLQPLAADGELETGEPGEIAAGAGEVRHEAAADRIGHLHEHDRQGVPLSQSRHHRRAGGEDQVRREADQLGCLAVQEAGVAGRPAVLQAQVAPLRPAQLPQPGLKRLDAQFQLPDRSAPLRTAHQPAAADCFVVRVRRAASRLPHRRAWR